MSKHVHHFKKSLSPPPFNQKRSVTPDLLSKKQPLRPKHKFTPQTAQKTKTRSRENSATLRFISQETQKKPSDAPSEASTQISTPFTSAQKKPKLSTSNSSRSLRTLSQRQGAQSRNSEQLGRARTKAESSCRRQRPDTSMKQKLNELLFSRICSHKCSGQNGLKIRTKKETAESNKRRKVLIKLEEQYAHLLKPMLQDQEDEKFEWTHDKIIELIRCQTGSTTLSRTSGALPYYGSSTASGKLDSKLAEQLEQIIIEEQSSACYESIHHPRSSKNSQFKDIESPVNLSFAPEPIKPTPKLQFPTLEAVLDSFEHGNPDEENETMIIYQSGTKGGGNFEDMLFSEGSNFRSKTSTRAKTPSSLSYQFPSTKAEDSTMLPSCIFETLKSNKPVLRKSEIETPSVDTMETQMDELVYDARDVFKRE